MSNPEPMTSAQVGVALGIQPRQVARLVETGKLTPLYKLPGIRGAYLFDAATVEASE